MQKLEKGCTYSGFLVKEIVYEADANANLYTLEHLHSGATLYYLDKDDENKVFGIAFKTIPEDSTGIFHILEHSVLNGSRKFPVKEPFVNLLKSSMQTFLNAMTFPDKTVYPVASCNEKDLTNLMDVYLDAVFHPNFYNSPEMFMQEGWHYELLDESADPVYKGVVFNEMTGAMSSVDSILTDEMGAGLFPDVAYRHNSGGDPEHIPELTYEKFLATHKKFYRADNSTIFLYGNVDIEEKLAFIDREYLSYEERGGFVPELPMQAPVVSERESAYEVTSEEELTDGYYYTRAYVVCDYADTERNLAISLLNNALMGDNQSPLKKKLMDAGLGADVSGSFNDGIQQSFYCIQLSKAAAGKKDEFIRILNEGWAELCEKGIDKELLRASFNRLEFNLREMNTGGFSKGLFYYLDLLSSTLYGGKATLGFSETLEKLRAAIETDYFENLIREVFLESKHHTTVVCAPSATLGAEKAERAAQKLHAYKESLTQEQVSELIAANKQLIEHQSTPDSPEATAKIPTLELSDLASAPKSVPTEEEQGEYKLLYHDIDTNGISYINYHFDLDSCTEEDFPYVGILTDILLDADTSKHDSATLGNLFRLYTGALDFNSETIVHSRTQADFKLRLGVSVLPQYTEKAIALVSELLTDMRFDKEKIRRSLLQRRVGQKSTFTEHGNSIALMRAASYTDLSNYVNERIVGIENYRFVCDLCDHFEERYPALEARLYDLCRRIFVLGGLTLSFAGARSEKEKFASLPLGIPQGKSEPVKIDFAEDVKNESFVIPSGVSYDAKVLGLEKLGMAYSGKMLILSKLMRLDYLWTAVRVKGGAYGVDFNVDVSGLCTYTSYRDPNVEETFAAYDTAGDAIRNMDLTQTELKNYIISTIASRENPVSPKMEALNADKLYFRGVTEEQKAKIRAEILSTTVEDIRSYAELLDGIAKQGAVCTLGNGEKVRACKRFDSVNDL